MEASEPKVGYRVIGRSNPFTNYLGRIVSIQGTGRTKKYVIIWKGGDEQAELLASQFWLHDNPEGATSESDRDDFEGVNLLSETRYIFET